MIFDINLQLLVSSTIYNNTLNYRWITFFRSSERSYKTYGMAQTTMIPISVDTRRIAVSYLLF